MGTKLSCCTQIIISHSEQLLSVMPEYACDECRSTFATMEELAEHYKRNHPMMAKKYLKDTSC
jgi:hypothetical protein